MEPAGGLRQGSLDRGLEGVAGRVAALGLVLVLDLAPERLDWVPFGARGGREQKLTPTASNVRIATLTGRRDGPSRCRP
ncbi:MAG: hypothetical protein M3R02_13655 [Chloroflexota bacterium]|nr:hypothetical protein [Chloroflexota bacterium]